MQMKCALFICQTIRRGVDVRRTDVKLANIQIRDWLFIHVWGIGNVEMTKTAKSFVDKLQQQIKLVLY